MKFDLDSIRDYLNHKFSAHSPGSYHYVCDVCHIMVFCISDTKIVFVNKLSMLEYDTEILDCKTQQIKNLLE